VAMIGWTSCSEWEIMNAYRNLVEKLHGRLPYDA